MTILNGHITPQKYLDRTVLLVEIATRFEDASAGRALLVLIKP